MRSLPKRRSRSGLWVKASTFGNRADKKLFGRRPEMGLFGVDAGILILFFLAFLGVMAWVLSEGLGAIFMFLVRGLDFTPMLVHTPGIAGQPLFAETMASGLVALTPEGQPLGIFAISTVMGQLYGKIQLIALVGLIIAAIVLGITYVSEQFNLVGKGTAFQLFSESALILVLLFIFPIIFNGAAAVLNGLNQQVILSEPTAGPREMVETVAEAAVTFTDPGILGLVPVAGAPVAFGSVLMTLIQATASFTVIFSTFLAGVGRLLLIGMIAAAFPLVLVLRLIPPLRNIATELQGALIGLMVGTVLASLIIRISWGVLTARGMGELTIWAVGCGTLVAVVFMLFMMAQGFRRLGGMITGTLSAGAAGVVGGTIAAGAGLGIGMATGGAAAAATAGRVGAGTLGAIGRGTLAGGAAGMRGGPLGALIGAPGAAREAELAEEGRQLRLGTEKLGDTSIAEKFHGDFTGKSYGDHLLKLTPDQKAQLSAIGAQDRKALNEGTIGTDLLQRDFSEVTGRPLGAVKRSGIERQELAGGLKDEVIRIDSARGTEATNLWLGDLHYRAAGGRLRKEFVK